MFYGFIFDFCFQVGNLPLFNFLYLLDQLGLFLLKNWFCCNIELLLVLKVVLVKSAEVSGELRPPPLQSGQLGLCSWCGWGGGEGEAGLELSLQDDGGCLGVVAVPRDVQRSLALGVAKAGVCPGVDEETDDVDTVSESGEVEGGPASGHEVHPGGEVEDGDDTVRVASDDGEVKG